MERQDSVQRFLELIRRSHRGKFKVYIGMSAGVGKTCRMLQEARQLLDAGVDVRIGYIETHGRAGTEALVEGLPLVPRRRLFYKGKELEEMDTQAIVNLRPEIVVVDELAHTNIEGSENPKRWQDVMQILDAGISVISAVNIQHIEGLNEVVEEITGIEIRERVPDSVLAMADEVVNIDLTADELIERLKAGKIYRPDKIAAALGNFFTQDNLLQLRELALKEVALRVEKKVDSEVTGSETFRRDKLLAVIDSSEKRARRVIRKTARMATHLNAAFTVLKNDGILPLKQNEKQTILVCGPRAGDMDSLVGGWSSAQEGLTIADAIAAYAGENATVIYESDNVERIAELAKDADIIIVSVGEPSYQHDPPWGYDTLEITGSQQEILEAAKASGKPMVTVVTGGRPYILTWCDENTNAILEAYYPGSQGGIAIAETLFGLNNPTGKTPLQFPRDMDSVRNQEGDVSFDLENPLYDYGWGLSYGE